MMHVTLLIAVVALVGQVGAGRYGEGAADASASTAETASSSPAGDASTGTSELTSQPETPEPTLESAAASDLPTGEGQTPDRADTSQPLYEPSAEPTAVDNPTAQTPTVAPPSSAATPPEASVLTADGPRPSELIATLLKAPTAGQLPGVPLTLGEAVRDARTRQDQTTRAKAYWELATGVGEYYLALAERTQLVAIHQGIAVPGPTWEKKRREYDARAEMAKQSAQAAQLRLELLLGSAGEGVRPLPADLPHCGRYNTEYQEIFAGRPNATAKQLDELLPLRYEQLRSQTRAVAEAHDWLNQVSESRDPNTDGTGLLQAYDLLSLRRRAFLATARDYNQEIAAYTELAAPAHVAPDRLVAMLIRTSTDRSQQAWQRSAVQQTGGIEAEPPAAAPRARTDAGEKGATGAAAPGRRTYREVRRPLQRLFGREKSIVVERLLIRRGDDREK